MMRLLSDKSTGLSIGGDAWANGQKGDIQKRWSYNYLVTDRIIPNPKPCTGCLNCLMVCAQNKTGSAQPEGAGIRVQLDPFSGVHEICVCRQCKSAQCAEACPRNAIVRNDATLAWEIDRSVCIKCGTCVKACPFDAMFWNNPESQPVKCDLCGGKPHCIHACHFGVLHLAGSKREIHQGIPEDDLDPDLGRG